jgi:hypothetical protein
MAKGAAIAALPTLPSPPPNLADLFTTTTWSKGQAIHRIHGDIYRHDEFNPGKGNARFSPIFDAKGLPIPTMYGGDGFECAAMETVFHDVPVTPGLKTYDRIKLEAKLYSAISPDRDLILADLSNTALRKVGISRAQLIDTEKDRYPYTRRWAEAYHAQCLNIDGLCWVSRQDDRAFAVVLFGDRTRGVKFDLVRPSSDVATGTTYSSLLALADRIGVALV